jgi:hypothetical protein
VSLAAIVDGSVRQHERQRLAPQLNDAEQFPDGSNVFCAAAVFGGLKEV